MAREGGREGGREGMAPNGSGSPVKGIIWTHWCGRLSPEWEERRERRDAHCAYGNSRCRSSSSSSSGGGRKERGPRLMFLMRGRW